jgi:hypothetical protein
MLLVVLCPRDLVLRHPRRYAEESEGSTLRRSVFGCGPESAR